MGFTESAAANRDKSEAKAKAERRNFLIKISIMLFVALAYFLGMSFAIMNPSCKCVSSKIDWGHFSLISNDRSVSVLQDSGGGGS